MSPVPRGDYEKTGEKLCPECGQVKPLSEFHRPPSWKGRPQTYCKPCALARNKTWREENKERRFVYQRERKLLASYGIGLYEYESLLEAQGGLCAVCKESPGTRLLDVDHCHVRGEVRGLLCNRCNRVLGHANDDTDLLRKLIAYVETWNEILDRPIPHEIVWTPF